MLRVSNPVKVQEWTGRLFRFKKSAVSVAQFCDAEGVSAASFYQWKRKLRDQSASGRASRLSAAK